MINHRFLYTLFLLAGLIARTAFTQNVGSLPIIQGEINDVKAIAQGEMAFFFPGKAPALSRENCTENLNCALHRHGIEVLAISPEGIMLVPQRTVTSVEEKKGISRSIFPSHTLFVSTQQNEQSPALATLQTGHSVVDRTPALAFLNSETISQLAHTIETIDLTLTSDRTRKHFTEVIPTSTDSIAVFPTVTTEAGGLSGLITTLGAIPTQAVIEDDPEMSLCEDSKAIRLEMESGDLVIRPTPSKPYDCNSKTSYSLSYYVRQAGTTQASETTAVVAGETTLTPAPTSTEDSIQHRTQIPGRQVSDTNTELEKKYFKTCDSEVLQRLLASDKEFVNRVITLSDRSIITPLHKAVECGHTENVKTLLEAGADRNLIKNSNILFFAACKGFKEIVESLIHARADPDSTAKKDGATPLFAAAQNGYSEVVTILIAAGASINAATKNGDCPIHIAAFQGHNEVVKVLLDSNVDPNFTTKNGDTPLYNAAQNGHAAVVETLLNYDANPNIAKNNEEACSLRIATQNGHTGIVSTLLKFGADPRSIHKEDGATLLHLAAQYGHTDIVKILKDHGADLYATMNNGASPLHSAAYSGNALLVEWFLKAGLKPNVINNFKATPLHIAASMGHTDVVNVILNYNSDPNIVTIDNATPLLTATLNGHAEVANILLAVGADSHLAMHDGLTPLNAAALNGHSKLIEILLIAGADPNTPNKDKVTPLHSAAQNGHPACVRVLLAAGVSPDIITSSGLTPLIIAAGNGHPACVRALLDAGASPDITTPDGLTPLRIAARDGRKECVQALLDAGVNPDK